MTEKRFTDNGVEEIEYQSFTDNLTEKTYWIDNGLDEIIDLLNDFNDENERLKAHYNSLSHNNGLLYDECINKIDALKKENEQLKQRNNRQAKQLDRLYNLIEEKDWRTLSDITDDVKRCEELLQFLWVL